MNSFGPQAMMLTVDGDAEATRYDAGTDWMCGVLASALGKYLAPSSREGRNDAVAALREVAALADTPAIWPAPWTDGGQLAVDALVFLQARVTTPAGS